MITATTTAPADRPSKGEVTRRAILAAAIDRFGRDGFRTTSVADIARDAGVSGTAAYAYFANKEALFLAAVDHDTAEVIREGIGSIFDVVGSDGTGAVNRDAVDGIGTNGAAGGDGGVDGVVADPSWRQSLVFTLVDALDDHPLARRLLGGLEPEASARVIDIPALNDLRRVCAEQLRHEQKAGLVRTDIDPEMLGRGIVTILLSLLMSVTQLGLDATVGYAADVTAVFDAALDPPIT